MIHSGLVPRYLVPGIRSRLADHRRLTITGFREFFDQSGFYAYLIETDRPTVWWAMLVVRPEDVGTGTREESIRRMRLILERLQSSWLAYWTSDLWC